jgi:transcription initiation factor TFIIH subunit 1
MVVNTNSNSKDVSTSYDSVKYKKIPGTLTLTKDDMTFSPSSSSLNSENNGGSSNNNIPSLTTTSCTWSQVSKHQVSPANHPKAMLKVILVSADGDAANGSGNSKPLPSSLTFQFDSRQELERIRKDISDRLQSYRSHNKNINLTVDTTTTGTKRRHPDSATHAAAATTPKLGRTTSSSFAELDKTAVAVVRSSLLASNPNLRAQHQYLVQESETLDEDDFWNTHQGLLEEEYARISGIARAGTSSLLQSHVQVSSEGRLSLGVEEMRQIFIMHPAVHRAYEEKVPLELSDEQFWRKYLESEYFHLDRGKIGAASRSSGGGGGGGGPGGASSTSRGAATMGNDDMFSRYDQKLRESGQVSAYGGSGVDDGTNAVASTFGTNGRGVKSGRKWGTKLAVGQFDLAATFATERGDLLEGPKDNHPPDADDDTNGRKVIQKYNRHWAMVLNPEDAVAGSNLLEVARSSVDDTIPDDDDAKAGGGLDAEMQRLVGFANASSDTANHALGIGESDEYETLKLKNIAAYSGGGPMSGSTNGSSNNNKNPLPAEVEKIRQNNKVHASRLLSKIDEMMKGGPTTNALLERTKITFPDPNDGDEKRLLLQLTRKMDMDSRTEADTLEIVNSLPEDFKKRLYSYFRRSSELLRHFFGLRRLMDSCSGPGGNNQDKRVYMTKMGKIRNGMETVYNELYQTRQKIEGSTKEIVTMRKMCDQILEQLNHAFNLTTTANSSGNGGGGSGGGGGGFEVVDILDA